MANLKIHELTESEEMYLITITRLGETGVQGPIAISYLADALKVQPASVHQMIHKLQEANLVSYEPYKGVTLREDGKQWARLVLRLRRLWEVFFVEHLELSIEEADELACHMEHITPPHVANRLADFLDHPLHSPQGFLIPKNENSETMPMGKTLSIAQAGDQVEILTLPIDENINTFLKNQGLALKEKITVLAAGSNGEMLIAKGAEHLHLSKVLTDQIMVRKIEAIQ